MTGRAIALGLGLGLFISLFTYFNNWIVGQTQLISNFLPIAIFGLAAVSALFVNPLLLYVGPRWPLRPRELCSIVAIALAACGWPASNFYRYLVPVTAMPLHWIKTAPGWQSQHVMSYVPGAAAELAEGHLLEPEGLVRELARAQTEPLPTPALRLWLTLGSDARRAVVEASSQPRLRGPQKRELVRFVNLALRRPELFDPEAFAGLEASPALRRLLDAASLPSDRVVLRNRLLLSESLPRFFLPPPAGGGALPNEGRSDPLVIDTLLSGRSSANRLSSSPRSLARTLRSVASGWLSRPSWPGRASGSKSTLAGISSRQRW